MSPCSFAAVAARRQRLHGAGVDEDVVVDAGVAAKDAFGSDESGQRTLDLLPSSLTAHTLKTYAGRLSQFAEFCHDSENISPLEGTTATVVMYAAWIGHIAPLRHFQVQQDSATVAFPVPPS
eukprot:jgi/Tetstr1/457145/TSEL_043795.t1